MVQLTKQATRCDAASAWSAAEIRVTLIAAVLLIPAVALRAQPPERLPVPLRDLATPSPAVQAKIDSLVGQVVQLGIAVNASAILDGRRIAA